MMSPYPTVVIVVIAQYMHARYWRGADQSFTYAGSPPPPLSSPSPSPSSEVAARSTSLASVYSSYLEGW